MPRMINDAKFDDVLRRHHQARGPEPLGCDLGSMLFARRCETPAEAMIEVDHHCDGEVHMGLIVPGCQECIDIFVEKSGNEYVIAGSVAVTRDRNPEAN